MTSEHKLKVQQVTRGPNHHFFGYIGHVQNIPWNLSERYILALESNFHDHLPSGHEPAGVVLIDTHDNYSVSLVDQSRGWNPQQGTMFYWNPEAQENQFFFNDRDAVTNEVFCVLFDRSLGPDGERVREYRFQGRPIGNSGVAQQGGWFLGINYGRLGRLRAVTGYHGAADWTEGIKHPKDDGVFKVNVGTGECDLLVSFNELAEAIRPADPQVDELDLFINHTLWSRDDTRIFFFVRGGWQEGARKSINAAFVLRPDGRELTRLGTHIGGHPEWDFGGRMIGALSGRQVVFDVDRQLVVGQLGDTKIFPDAQGDVALSPEGDWLVNGHKDSQEAQNYFTFYRRSDGTHVRSPGFDIGSWVSGDLRQDPSPCWNRSGSKILVPGLSARDDHTRQLFLISLLPDQP